MDADTRTGKIANRLPSLPKTRWIALAAALVIALGVAVGLGVSRLAGTTSADTTPSRMLN